MRECRVRLFEPGHAGPPATRTGARAIRLATRRAPRVGLEYRPAVARARRPARERRAHRLRIAPAGERTPQPAQPVEVAEQRMDRRRLAERFAAQTRRERRFVVPAAKFSTTSKSAGSDAMACGPRSTACYAPSARHSSVLPTSQIAVMWLPQPRSNCRASRPSAPAAPLTSTRLPAALAAAEPRRAHGEPHRRERVGQHGERRGIDAFGARPAAATRGPRRAKRARRRPCRWRRDRRRVAPVQTATRPGRPPR